MGNFSETLLCLDPLLHSIIRLLRSVLTAVTCTRLWSMECLQNTFLEGKEGDEVIYINVGVWII